MNRLTPPLWYRWHQSNGDRLVLYAPAKINLFLHIPGKRGDGFHHVQSLMQTVSWYDEITIIPRNHPGCELSVLSEDQPLGAGSDNLVNRSYAAMRARCTDLPGVEITLKKSIPMEAGLGGGSSDAAATLFGLNTLFSLGFSEAELAAIGTGIGSDVPFFFSSGSALVEGRGEIIRPVQIPNHYWVVVIKPQLGLPTGPAFAALGRDLTAPREMTTLPVLPDPEGLFQWLALKGNDFENWADSRLPVLGSLRKALQLAGAQIVRLSGSGSALFGLFRERPEIGWLRGESADKGLQAALHGAQIHLCQPIRRDNSGT